MPDAFCCGMPMKAMLDLGRFMEMQCQKCGDVIYAKKLSSMKPVMVDD